MMDACENVLVVDDDPTVRRLLRRCFEGDGYVVDEAATERDTLGVLAHKTIGLVTLDLNLGSDNGLSVARAIRRISDVPMIMVTGKDDLIDRVVGLEIGADDYITKPFHVREVLARARSVLRRHKAPARRSVELRPDTPQRSADRVYHFDGLTAFPDRLELRDRSGDTMDMTSGDLRLLFIFLENPMRVLSREKIMDDLNGIEWTPLDRSIDNQVARLRKKIERDPKQPALIKTVRGIGYLFGSDVTPGQNGSGI